MERVLDAGARLGGAPAQRPVHRRSSRRTARRSASCSSACPSQRAARTACTSTSRPRTSTPRWRGSRHSGRHEIVAPRGVRAARLDGHGRPRRQRVLRRRRPPRVVTEPQVVARRARIARRPAHAADRPLRRRVPVLPLDGESPPALGSRPQPAPPAVPGDARAAGARRPRARHRPRAVDPRRRQRAAGLPPAATRSWRSCRCSQRPAGRGARRVGRAVAARRRLAYRVVDRVRPFLSEPASTAALVRERNPLFDLPLTDP